MNFDTLADDLRRDEGWELKPYTDTVGKTTIGCGRNLDDVGISDDEARFLLENDIRRVWDELRAFLPEVDGLSEPRQRALANMLFNLGLPRFRGFENMLAAVRDGDFARAADEALDSRWANQVGARATRIADALRDG